MGFFGISINENVADLKKQIATLSELIKEQAESKINEEMETKSLEIQEQLDSLTSELQNLRNDYSIAQAEIIERQKSLDKVLAEKKEIEKKLKEKEAELDVKVQELNTLRKEKIIKDLNIELLQRVLILVFCLKNYLKWHSLVRCLNNEMMS